MQNRSAEGGFTLVEMMLALLLFSLLSVAGWQMVQTILRGQQQASEYQRHSGDLARLFSVLDNDLRHAFIPSGLDIHAGEPAFVAGNDEVILRVIRRNVLNPPAASLPSIQAVEWRYARQRLCRHAREEALCFPGVTALTVRYFSAGRWQAKWAAGYALPRALEVAVTSETGGMFTRLFVVGGGA